VLSITDEPPGEYVRMTGLGAVLRGWLAGTDRGVSPATSVGLLVVILLTLVLALALFVFAGG
jgi:hypothetical protein